MEDSGADQFPTLMFVADVRVLLQDDVSAIIKFKSRALIKFIKAFKDEKLSEK